MGRGAPERWLIGTFLATMVAPIYVVRWIGLAYWHTQTAATAILMIDVLAAALFIAIALRANRNYPLWIAGFQLVAVGAHLVRGVSDDISPLAIAMLTIGPSYCQLLVMLGGFLRHVLRERRFGSYRAWRVDPPLAGGLIL